MAKLQEITIGLDLDAKQFSNALQEFNKGNEALNLWKRWFKEDGDPYISDEVGYFHSCFFCTCYKNHLSGHEDDCIYLAAKELFNDTNSR